MVGNPKDQKYDLEERTSKFGEEVIRFARKISRDCVTKDVITQFVDAGTAIGVIYCEVDDAESKKDFRHKIGLCKKEARETKYWLRIIVVACPELKDAARILWTEAKELHLIFNSIFQKVSLSLK
jgi:four helix bundle protein